MKKTILVLLTMLVGCDNPTGPSPTTTTTTTTTVDVDLPPDYESIGPRVDEYARPQDIRGYSSFALGIRNVQLQAAIINNAHSFGWNAPRACAEHRTWSRLGLPDSPPIESPEAVHNIRQLLEVTARIPGTQLLLMTNCNLKEDGASFQTQIDWAVTVARVIMGLGIRGLKPTEPFRHVIFEAVNEHHHPNSSVRDTGKVNQIIDAIRGVAPGYNVTTDDNFSSPRDVAYNDRLRSDFADAHPWRVDFSASGLREAQYFSYGDYSGGGMALGADLPRLVPTRADFRRMVQQSGGGFILISEPIAYTDGADRGCCSPDKGLIEQVLRSCKREPGCAIVFHKDQEGLTADQPFPWMPHWNSL